MPDLARLDPLETVPDGRGHFGTYGGSFVPEILIPALEELKAAFAEAWVDASFQADYHRLLRNYVGRPTPLTVAISLGSEGDSSTFPRSRLIAMSTSLESPR